MAMLHAFPLHKNVRLINYFVAIFGLFSILFVQFVATWWQPSLLLIITNLYICTVTLHGCNQSSSS